MLHILEKKEKKEICAAHESSIICIQMAEAGILLMAEVCMP